MVIVCGTDFSAGARQAAEIAVGLARPSDEEVVLVHAVELPVAAPDDSALRADVERKLAEEARALGPGVTPVVRVGIPHEVLVEEATRAEARLLVVASRGRSGSARWFLGSTADRLARSSPVPLLVTRGEPDGLRDWTRAARPLKVLVCVDFEEATDAVVAAARSLCSGGPCSIHVAHAFEEPVLPFTFRTPVHPSTQWAELERLVVRELTRLAADLAPKGPPHERVHLLRGKPVESLSRFAEEAHVDVMVVGTHGRHGLDRVLLGSVAAGLLQRAPCPVFVTPLPERPSVTQIPDPEARPDEPAVPPPE